MRSRHSGWLARYLESFIPNNESVENLPQSCNSLCTVQGLKKVPARTLLILNNHHVDAWWGASAVKNPILANGDVNLLRIAYNDCMNATFRRQLGWVRSFVCRSYKARKTAHMRPANGQSTWHNRKTARYCHTFLHKLCRAYCTEIHRMRARRRLRWSKTMAMRVLAKTRKKRKKKYTKYKKFGERRMELKRKRGLWG